MSPGRLQGPTQDPDSIRLIFLLVATGVVVFWRAVLKLVAVVVVMMLVALLASYARAGLVRPGAVGLPQSRSREMIQRRARIEGRRFGRPTAHSPSWLWRPKALAPEGRLPGRQARQTPWCAARILESHRQAGAAARALCQWPYSVLSPRLAGCYQLRVGVAAARRCPP
jgi:hypothetical protein